MSSKKSTKKQQVTESRNKAAVEKASGLKVEQALGSITKAGLEIQQTLSGLSAGLIEKVADLTAVDQTIQLKKQELAALHDADKILLSIDELKAEHEATIQQLSKEAEDYRLKLEEDKADEVERRRRESEDYQYRLTQERKTEDDNWKELLRIRLRDEKVRQEEFEKSFKEREEVLAKKEADYQAALARFANFDNEVASAVKQQVAIVTNSMNKDFEHKTQMTAVTHKAEVDRLTAANQTLSSQVAAAQLTIAELQSQLKVAQEAQTQLAKDAVSAAANQKAQSDALALITNIGGNGSPRPRS